MPATLEGTVRVDLRAAWWAAFTRLLQAALDFKADSEEGRFPDPSELAGRAKDLGRFERYAQSQRFSPPIAKLTRTEERLWTSSGRYSRACEDGAPSEQWAALVSLSDAALSFPALPTAAY